MSFRINLPKYAFSLSTILVIDSNAEFQENDLDRLYSSRGTDCPCESFSLNLRPQLTGIQAAGFPPPAGVIHR